MTTPTVHNAQAVYPCMLFCVQVKDLLQLMIDATVDEDDDGNKCSAKKLTTRQIAGFSVDFLNAGYETTATTLGFIAYLLATHPDVQEKLQNKIDTYFDQNPVRLAFL